MATKMTAQIGLCKKECMNNLDDTVSKLISDIEGLGWFGQCNACYKQASRKYHAESQNSPQNQVNIGSSSSAMYKVGYKQP